MRYTNVLENNQVNIIPLAKILSDSIIEMIMQYLSDNNLPCKISEIPSRLCRNLDHQKWQIDDDRDSFEYILDIHQQSLLEGSKFSRQRRRINFFEREHTNDTVNIQYYNELTDEIKEFFFHHICTMDINSSEESSRQNIFEPMAIQKNLEYALYFGKKALIIKVDNRIVSLSMISYLDNHTASINHIKVDYRVQYIFQYTVYSLAKILKEKGFDEMNFEQDLGIEGLRVFKERLKPSRLLEKQIIRPRY